MAKITVQNTQITVIKQNEDDYISLTDMLKAKDGEFFFSNWLRNRNTIEFLGIWERLMNPNFNCAEFDIIKSQAGLNRFRLSAKEWTEKTNAIGIISKAVLTGELSPCEHKPYPANGGRWTYIHR